MTTATIAPTITSLADDTLRELAGSFGTPLFVFDERELAQRVSHLRNMLPERTGLCFAAKANPFVLPELTPLIDRLEICSPGEYRICRALGLPHDKIVVSGVHKSEEIVDAALSNPTPPAAITIESTAQLDLVTRVAMARGKRAPILLRLTSGNQFGLDRAELMSTVRKLRKALCVNLLGIQFFSGTQKTSLKRLQRELDGLDKLVAELGEELGWTPCELEIGPGLPVSYFEGDAFDEAAFIESFSGMLENMAFSGSITLELGRSLTASCGTYLTRVVDTKVNAGQRYAIVDGGIHQLVYYGQSMAMKQPPCHLLDAGTAAGAVTGATSAGAAAGASAPDDAVESWNICGSLCTVNDILAKQLPLAGLDTGSILAFRFAGAYCMTEGISLFLSRDLPKVVVLKHDDEPVLVRDGLRTDIINTPLHPLG
ncbi:diaminopimelate decarboxylase family protein [Enorma phocaeensis]|uniref:Alanine racemase n=1 Tax=Enorma phocaeensis TaxID=1871019 RepID=A0A921IUC0_9ACTN|nr:alanine racemase [Enorma phocaeensis]HJG37303.1 alanine racemase [Enorma phocaeensis]